MSNQVVKVETLIVGAGVTGLMVAARLKNGGDFVVVDAADSIGGYCKTVVQDGFTWDYSGHFFHFRDSRLEAWLLARMPQQRVLKVAKKSSIFLGGRHLDFPFQKNIHQLPQADFIACLVDLYEAHKKQHEPQSNFKEMLRARYGQGICDRFLVPYNEKLYATDLSTLDVDAMGRFFPHASFDDVMANMRSSDNVSYNSHFTYPEGGAIQYVNAIASEVEPSKVWLNVKVEKVDVVRREVTLSDQRVIAYQRLVSTAPFPELLSLVGEAERAKALSWNQVMVFNLGFDRKGTRPEHWIYYPEREVPFYRVGFYDNIFEAPRMSLYVELGFDATQHPNSQEALPRVLEGLRKVGVVTDQKLISQHSVVMNPAYVHMTTSSQELYSTMKEAWAHEGVYSLGRYGRWTYCSIEDNMLEAEAWVEAHG